MIGLKRIAMLLFCASAMLAQNLYTHVYNPTGLAAAPVVVTYQIPAANGSDARFGNVTLSLPGSGLCLVTFERDGSIATATAATVAKLNPGVTPSVSKVEAFTASNSTGGTVVGRHYIPLGVPVTLDISKQWLAIPGATVPRNTYAARQNLTIRTCAVTGDASVTSDWQEMKP